MGDKERVTIMINDRIMKKLRSRQSKRILDTQSSISFSKLVNEDLAVFYKMQNFKY